MPEDEEAKKCRQRHLWKRLTSKSTYSEEDKVAARLRDERRETFTLTEEAINMILPD